jgi:lipoprotein-anchoring transpeptidase ErfK/SrfK
MMTCVIGCLAFGIDAHATATRPVPVPEEFGRKAEVSIWQENIASRIKISTFEDTFLLGGFLASGDVDADGKEEIVIGSGPGRKNEVRVYRIDGTLVKSFVPYAETFQGGVRIAVGDINKDGKAEIVTAPGPGIESNIYTFDGMGAKLSEGALAYAKSFVGGVHVVLGDLNKDGALEIITSAGPGGGPHIRLFDADMVNKGKDFFAYDASMRDGVTIAVVKTPWGDQLVTGVESWSEPFVRRYSFDQNGARLDKEFYAFASSSHSGVSVFTFDLDNDGTDEIIASQNGGTSPEVRMFDLYGTLYKKYLLHDPNYRGALSVASIQADADAVRELMTVNSAPIVRWTATEKQIVVDISEQRLYAYERGRLAKTFFISSGVARHPSPIVETKVLEKIPVKRYKWTYAVGSSDNYDLPNVKWNLRVYGPVYIHGAYWHHNFGYRMSHGCINVDYPDAEWIYNWADIGTPVSIRE